VSENKQSNNGLGKAFIGSLVLTGLGISYFGFSFSFYLTKYLYTDIFDPMSLLHGSISLFLISFFLVITLLLYLKNSPEETAPESKEDVAPAAAKQGVETRKTPARSNVRR